ncbi:MAG: SDR family oxidoreductase [Synergistaceae bacterium]|nr:SDR family oxidoreductase [Synergistaceae bacterium]
MINYPELPAEKSWLVTGAAGFIGSHLTQVLLSKGQHVTGLDDLSAGRLENIEAALKASEGRGTFKFIKGSITDIRTCLEASEGVEYVLHHAALASVPASMKDPVRYNEVNVSGFVNVLQAAKDNNVKRVVYASSSAVYGDDETPQKVENIIGKFLSPYAMTKYINEVYAEFFTRVYGLECVGLRYFNVFGERQDPNGAYAAVIPKWISAIRAGELPIIYGDGTATRDFCAVQNVVAANLLAAMEKNAPGEVFNIGCGVSTSLGELLREIYEALAPGQEIKFQTMPPREGDILHSSASIEKAKKILKYNPVLHLREGIKEYVNSFGGR